MARGEGGDRGWGVLDSITDSRDMSLSKLQEMVKDAEAGGATIHGRLRVGPDLATDQQ